MNDIMGNRLGNPTKRWARNTSAIAGLSILLVGCGGNSMTHTVQNSSYSVSNAASDVAQKTANVAHTAARDPHGVGMANLDFAKLNTQISQKIVSKHLAIQAYVYTVKQMAFVAVELPNGMHREITNAEKTAITSVVKQSDKQVNTVYVTARPDVFQRFESFFREAKMGKPLSDLWTNMKTSINRAWPQTKTERF
jgi:YhcN/YlaJ family sporulation lipoprotein